MTDLRVLVVEDDPDGQEVVGRILEFHNIYVDVVASGEEALSLLAESTYSATIVDLNLPQMNGWGLLEAIQSKTYMANMPCIAITAYHSPEVAIKAIEAGFVAYFPKPLEPTTFVTELQRYIA